MAKTAQQAYDEIVEYIQKCDRHYSHWYAGIASDPRNRLFQDHNVIEETDPWIFRYCISSKAARNVEEALLELGCDGGPGGGDETTDYVYAYLKSSHTSPWGNFARQQSQARKLTEF
jgi:hypothetical protein